LKISKSKSISAVIGLFDPFSELSSSGKSLREILKSAGAVTSIGSKSTPALSSF
jgi:hypothetical protein